MRDKFSTSMPSLSILDSKEDLEFYGKDRTKGFSSNASLVLLPSTAEEVQKIVGICNSKRISLVPSGGRTGLAAGAVAPNKEVVLSLEKMKKILDVNTVEQTLTCEPGVPLEIVQKEAQKHGFYYPVDLASRGTCTIGGNLATNAGGIRVIRYGGTRDWVIGLKFVSGKGELIDLKPLVKNQTGYDLKNLVIGSEGTLGIITEVTLKLTTPPQPSVLSLCGIQELDKSFDILLALRKAGFVFTLFEFFQELGLEFVLKYHNKKDPFSSRYPFYVLAEVEESNGLKIEDLESTLSSLMEDGVIKDVVVSQSTKQYSELISLRELISDTLTTYSTPHKNDISVPISAIPKFSTELVSLIKTSYPSFIPVLFGHIGDGNIHVNILKPDSLSSDEFFEQCKKLDTEIFSILNRYNGSISAEHGIGLLKPNALHFSRSAEEIAIMKNIKRIFDPNGIMNPGKVFASF